MLERNPSQSPCITCAVATARRRLVGRARLPGRGRLARLLRQAGLALMIGAAASVPLAELAPAPSADALSFADLPRANFTAPSRSQPGYQLATTYGDVLSFGAATSGTGPATLLRNPVTDVARTRTGAGSWTVTADGGVITSGDARFYGSLGDRPVNSPVVSLSATRSGRGYWLAAVDGGVFTFGDAGFHGSLAGTPGTSPVVDLVPTPRGRGYWLVTADGGVFTFGDATFRGSVTSALQAPVTAMAATRSGRGYWLTSADGGVFTFGDAKFYGRPEDAQRREPVVDIAPSPSGRGYWLATADGGVFTYGDAPFLGSTGGRSFGKVVGIAAGVGRPVDRVSAQAVPRRIHNRYGNDISWPQCDGDYPAPGYGHAVVGVTGGRPFRENRCLADQWQWAISGGSGGAVYVNVASPKPGDPRSMNGPAGACGINDLPCQTYNHSANNMTEALAYARASGVDAPMWWLDVEWLNYWTKNQALNTLTVKAATETLQKAGLDVGVYSTALQWRTITGGFRNGLPVWIAGSPNDAESPSWCDRTDKDFTGGGVWLVQSLPIRFDVNYACTPALENASTAFRFRD